MFEYENKTAEELLPMAEQGDAEAQFQLGLHYASGAGGARQDWARAAEWTRRAAEQGHVGAQANMGVFYETGNGAPQDGAKAVE